ncbi:MAG: hypothetical protein HP497_12775 [Nitrospira sp.]|nr:hypothetical protein [Nitrospira sp.]
MNERVGTERWWCELKTRHEGIGHLNGHHAFKIDGAHNLVGRELGLGSYLKKDIARLPGLVIRP